MTELMLLRGQIALLDPEDVSRVSERGLWRLHQSVGRKAYVVRKEAGRFTWLHRFILGAPKGCFVDHVNGNPLDNRKANLRLATARENNLNAGLRSDNCSGYKGVSWNKRSGKWVASVALAGKQTTVGYFADKDAAYAAYCAAAARLHGEFCYPLTAALAAKVEDET